ncbi:MAG: GNAT family N-acetyltransferase [Actinobacteria bacterium]|nr:GNAT family N-acetyltransferase [Actinomycetota bacterium]
MTGDAAPDLALRHALRRDLPEVVSVWVDAFTRDPYLRWMAPDDATWARFGPAWLGFIADQCFECGHTYLGRSGDVAVAWIPPDVTFATPDVFDRAYETVAAIVGEERAAASIETVLQARAHSIAESHWTLQYFGVRTSAQGRGVGALAVAPILTVCDTEGVPCGLVSTNPRNVSFYERQGFRTMAEVATPDGGAVLRPMHRAPRA